MAGRIRTIKPELLEDTKAGRLDHRTWRLFVSLWLLADDYGNLVADPEQVDGVVFWASRDPSATAASLARLREVGMLELYELRGQLFAHITGWSRHQRVEHPGKPRVPGPSEACARLIRESLATVPESLTPDLRPPTSDHDHDREGEHEGEPQIPLQLPDTSEPQHSHVAPAEPAPTREQLRSARATPQRKIPQEPRGTRLPARWAPMEALYEWARTEPAVRLDRAEVDRALNEFRDYWQGVPGAKGRKLNWEATFRNRLRSVRARNPELAEPVAELPRRPPPPGYRGPRPLTSTRTPTVAELGAGLDALGAPGPRDTHEPGEERPPPRAVRPLTALATAVGDRT